MYGGKSGERGLRFRVPELLHVWGQRDSGGWGRSWCINNEARLQPKAFSFACAATDTFLHTQIRYILYTLLTKVACSWPEG